MKYRGPNGGRRGPPLPMIVIVILMIAGAAGCKYFKKGGHDSVIRIEHVDAKWIKVDSSKMGVENGKKGASAKKILIEQLKASPRIQLDSDKGKGEINLIVSVIRGEEEPGDEEPSSSAAQVDGAEEEEENLTEVVYLLKYRGEEGWPLSTAVVVRTDDESQLSSPKSLKPIIRELVDSIIKQITLLHAQAGELREALKDGDAQVVALSVQLLGEKRDKESVPALCEILDKSLPDDPIRDDLVGALEKIGDRRATPHLIRAFSDAEPWQEIQIIRALSVTGGEEAKQFLEAVASGHEFEPTRRIAVEALSNM